MHWYPVEIAHQEDQNRWFRELGTHTGCPSRIFIDVKARRAEPALYALPAQLPGFYVLDALAAIPSVSWMGRFPLTGAPNPTSSLSLCFLHKLWCRIQPTKPASSFQPASSLTRPPGSCRKARTERDTHRLSLCMYEPPLIRRQYWQPPCLCCRPWLSKRVPARPRTSPTSPPSPSKCARVGRYGRPCTQYPTARPRCCQGIGPATCRRTTLPTPSAPTRNSAENVSPEAVRRDHPSLARSTPTTHWRMCRTQLFPTARSSSHLETGLVTGNHTDPVGPLDNQLNAACLVRCRDLSQ